MKDDNRSLHLAGSRDIFLLAILALSLSLNVLLGWKVQSLGSRFQTPHDKIIEGLTITAITAAGIDGKEKTIAFDIDGKPTVLYVFSPTCVWCERNLNNIKALENGVGHSYRFIGLSLSDKGLDEYVNSHQLSLPIYKQPSQESMRLLGLGSTPQTVVISPQGTVLKSWVGAYGSSMPEVESYFGLKLPGVIEPQ